MKKMMILILVLIWIWAVRVFGTGAQEGALRSLTAQEQKDLVKIIPIQRDILAWAFTSESQIQEKALVLVELESAFRDIKSDKQCRRLNERKLTEVTPKVPLSILIKICLLQQFRKRNPRLEVEGSKLFNASSEAI